jgi:hypothetical protein
VDRRTAYRHQKHVERLNAVGDNSWSVPEPVGAEDDGDIGLPGLDDEQLDSTNSDEEHEVSVDYPSSPEEILDSDAERDLQFCKDIACPREFTCAVERFGGHT